MDTTNIDWDNIDKQELDKNLDFIFDQAVNMLNQQRESHNTLTQKASVFLTTVLAILTAVSTLVIPRLIKAELILQIAFAAFAICAIISTILFSKALQIRNWKYTYPTPDYFLGTTALYKKPLNALKRAWLKEMAEYITYHTTAFNKITKNISWGLRMFIAAPTVPLLIFLYSLLSNNLCNYLLSR